MKKYFTLSIVMLFISMNAQISFGKENVNGNSTLLDFDDNPLNVKGLILPPTTAALQVKRGNTNENGILVFDREDSVIKVYENDSWRKLSQTGNTTEILSITNTSLDKGKGIIIGDENTTAEGNLVLESTNKAMILPKINNPNQNVANPYPGMICYDTNEKSLAVYNGIEWTYW